jgi:two-component system CheB/CheR fusion protein
MARDERHVSASDAAYTHELERRLAEAEANVRALVAAEIDAVLDGTDPSPLLLREAQHALQRRKEILERQVAQRTAALNQSNTRLAQANRLLARRNQELVKVKMDLEAELAQRRRVEQDLRDAQARHELTLAAAEIGTWTCDLVQRWLMLDDNMARILAIPPGEVVDPVPERYRRHVHADDRADVESVIQRAITGGEPFECEFRMVRCDNAVRWVMARGRVERDPADGTLLRLSGVVLDVTEQREIRAEHEALLAEFAILNRNLEKRVQERDALLDELTRITRTLEDRVAERTSQVKALATALALAEQRERQRISQVLHNDLQQLLYSQALRLEMLRQLPVADPTAVLPHIDGIIELVQQAVNVTRALVTELNPPDLQSDEMETALVWLAEHMEEAHGLHVELAIQNDCCLPSRDIRELLTQMVRELLFNVVKHAGVDRAQVSLQQANGTLVLRIADDGQGFDVREVRARHVEEGGIGLFSIAERLSLVGGRLEIDAAPGQGTRMTIFAPTRAN